MAYKALTELTQAKQLRPTSIELLVTLGSPLGSQCANVLREVLEERIGAVDGAELIGDGNLRKPDAVGHWVNYWIAADKISGQVEAADWNAKMSDPAENRLTFSLIRAGLDVLTKNVLVAAHNSYLDAHIDIIALHTSASLGEVCRDAFSSFVPVPEGFGAAYNVVGQQRELLLRANCVDSELIGTINIEIGSNSGTQFVYDRAYILRDDPSISNDQWRKIRLSDGAERDSLGRWVPGSVIVQGQKAQDPWFIGPVTLYVPWRGEQLDGRNAIAAYTCQWSGFQWLCGCRDAQCSQQLWQAQAFERR